MNDDVIQKIYDLNQEDLSYLICELVFGRPEDQDEVLYGQNTIPLETMTTRYRTEVAIGTKAIVKTYGYDKKENGSAFVIKQHFKNIKEDAQKNYFSDAVNLVVVADQNSYVDVQQFNLKNSFPEDRYSFTCALDFKCCNYINFSDQDYEQIYLYPGNGGDLDKTTMIYYNSHPSLMNTVKLDTSTEIYKEKAPAVTPRYLHVSSKIVDLGFARFLSKTRQPGGDIDQTTVLTITFIPIEKAHAWFAGQ